MNDLLQVLSQPPPRDVSAARNGSRSRTVGEREEPVFSDVLVEKRREEEERAKAAAAGAAQAPVQPLNETPPVNEQAGPETGSLAPTQGVINQPGAAGVEPQPAGEAGQPVADVLPAQPVDAGLPQPADVATLSATDGEVVAVTVAPSAAAEQNDAEVVNLVAKPADAEAETMIAEAAQPAVAVAEAAPVSEPAEVEPAAVARKEPAQPEGAPQVAEPLEQPQAASLGGQVTTTPPQHAEGHLLVRSPEQLSTDVAARILRQAELIQHPGHSTLRLQLFPKELGQIDVVLMSSPHGLGITVTADQAGTGRLLEGQLNQLRQSLADAGVHLTHLNVQQESTGDRGSQATEHHRPTRSAREQREGPTGEGLDRLHPMRLGLSLVDYRV